LKGRRALAWATKSWKRASVSLKTVGVVVATGAAALVGWATLQFVT
jgi:hypothetical protein